MQSIVPYYIYIWRLLVCSKKVEQMHLFIITELYNGFKFLKYACLIFFFIFTSVFISCKCCIIKMIFKQESVWIICYESCQKCTPVFKCNISTWIFRFSTKRTMLLEFRYKYNILRMNRIHLQLEHIKCIGVC